MSLTAIFIDFFKDYAAIERKRNIRPRHHVHYWTGYDNKNAESIIDQNPDCPFLCNRLRFKELTQLLSNAFECLSLEFLLYEVKALMPSLKYLNEQRTKSRKDDFRPYLLKLYQVCTRFML
jgi:hypothetical protein